MDLKRLLSDYETVRAELEGAKTKPAFLRQKIELAERRLSELKRVIEAANGRKEDALVAFATGDTTEAELKTARDGLKAAIKEKTEFEEFLRASEKASQQIQKTIMDLSVKLNGLKHKFWENVAAELKDKITIDVIEKVHKVYASKSLAGGVGSYEGFLRELFPLLPLDENQRVQKELVEKFGFTE